MRQVALGAKHLVGCGPADLSANKPYIHGADLGGWVTGWGWAGCVVWCCVRSTSVGGGWVGLTLPHTPC